MDLQDQSTCQVLRILIHISNLPLRKVVAVYILTVVYEFGFSPPSFSRNDLASDRPSE